MNRYSTFHKNQVSQYQELKCLAHHNTNDKNQSRRECYIFVTNTFEK